jgi:hypothetical protein
MSDEQARNRRLATNIAAGRSPLDDEVLGVLRRYVAANLDVPGPRVGQLLDEIERLREVKRRASEIARPSAGFTVIEQANARYILGDVKR